MSREQRTSHKLTQCLTRMRLKSNQQSANFCHSWPYTLMPVVIPYPYSPLQYMPCNTGFPLSRLQEIPGLLQDTQNVFSGLCHSPAMLNFRQTGVTYSVYTVWQYNPSQNVHHKLQRNCSFSTQQEYFTHLFTQCGMYI